MPPLIYERDKFFMKKFLALLALFSVEAHAYVVPTYRDFKPATQVMLEHDSIDNAAVADAAGLKLAFAGATSAAVASTSTFLVQPDVPRNITVTPTGTTTDVESCVVTISGTNIKGASITDTVTFAANASTIQSGTKAFKTVSSVSWAADCESGTFAATWSVGFGDVLGLNHCLDQAGDVAWAVFDGAYEATRPTCVADADEVEKNTCDINGTLNDAKDIDLYYIQNFRCQ